MKRAGEKENDLAAKMESHTAELCQIDSIYLSLLIASCVVVPVAVRLVAKTARC